MEGNELHPRRDAKGIHRFDPHEVTEVAEQLQAHGRRSSRYDDQLPSFVLLRRLRKAEAEVQNGASDPTEPLLTEALDLLALLIDYLPPGRTRRSLASEVESFLERVGRHLQT
jgi:hypothetical protein